MGQLLNEFKRMQQLAGLLIENEIKTELIPIRKIGKGRTGILTTTYNDIISKVGKPNVTDMDDPSKVEASWAYETPDGKEIFIWCYKTKSKTCKSWSVDGDKETLKSIFGADNVK
jgi:hypothetical protein